MDQYNTSTTVCQEKELEKAFSACDLPVEDDKDLSLHRLSFCDLPLEDYQNPSVDRQSTNSPCHELFEFPLAPKTSSNHKNGVVFCGQLIKEQDIDDEDDDIRRYLFPLSSARLTNNSKEDLGSLSLVDSRPISSALSPKILKSQSYSSSLSKQKVVIGIKKIPPRMELSEIKKRQSRRNPSPMFPPVNASDLEVMAADEGCRGGAGRRSHWGLLRPLRCGAYFSSALAKASLGCIPRM